ncbi:hypothetical protein EDD21DRAFT_412913 [Dissophora ornata]|nr:hypothetical protein BGZ58_000711 [Dissophora ornata]KAI8603555.1 hypothetical protein EDD21DRAFT_412913 [Dissophora ornata]
MPFLIRAPSRLTIADNPPDDPEGSYALRNGLYNTSLLKDLNLLNFAGSQIPTAIATAGTTSNTNGAIDASAQPIFSISDYLVPSLQTKVWEDWQAADDFTAFDPQTFSSDLSALPFQLGMDGLIGNTTIWENDLVPADQAYDEFVFDLSPSAFETPATVNVADLIVGPNSMASSVSPFELVMPNDSTYQDLALASFYGFNGPSTDSYSESGSDSDDAEDSDESEDDVDGDDVIEETKISSEAAPLAVVAEVTPIEADPDAVGQEDAEALPVRKPDDPNKRRMEESLAARISNDLGPEHTPGLIRILKGLTADQEDEDEGDDVEVDLSCLDETMLVEVYQYVETCCMQTMGSILAAEQRERAAKAAEMEALARQRTPELSPSHSYTSSSSSSPSHPSSLPTSPSKGRRLSNANRKRNGGGIHHGPLTMPFQHETSADDLEQDASWSATAAVTHPYKGRRKRSSTGASRKMQKDIVQQYQQQPQQQHQNDHPQRHYQVAVAATTVEEAAELRAAGGDDNEMELGEDAEIDVVGI